MQESEAQGSGPTVGPMPSRRDGTLRKWMWPGGRTRARSGGPKGLCNCSFGDTGLPIASLRVSSYFGCWAASGVAERTAAKVRTLGNTCPGRRHVEIVGKALSKGWDLGVCSVWVLQLVTLRVSRIASPVARSVLVGNWSVNSSVKHRLRDKTADMVKCTASERADMHACSPTGNMPH